MNCDRLMHLLLTTDKKDWKFSRSGGAVYFDIGGQKYWIDSITLSENQERYVTKASKFSIFVKMIDEFLGRG